MDERRRNKRMDLSSKLIVTRLDSGEKKEIGIEVDNVSKTGIGFHSEELLEIGSVYEAYLTIWTQERIHAFIELVRIEVEADGYNYGGLFIGMPEMDLQRIDVYEIISEAEEKNEI